MAKEKRKNYQEIKNSNDKMMTQETQNALLGVLLFLLCLIGLLENGGPLGKFIRYIFVFLLGNFFPFALIFGCFVGIVLFIKREFKGGKLGLTAFSGIVFTISLLVLSSENEYSLASVFKNYRELFSSVDRGGLQVIIESKLGGGIIGYFFYSLVSSLVGKLGVKIVFLVFLVVFGYLFLKPALFYFINLFTKHLNKKQQYEKIVQNDESLLPNSLFKDEEQMEEIEGKTNDNVVDLNDDNLEPVENQDTETQNNKVIIEDLTDDDIADSKKIYSERNLNVVEDIIEDNEEIIITHNEKVNDTFDIFSDSIIKQEDIVRMQENRIINKIEREATNMSTFNIFEDNISEDIKSNHNQNISLTSQNINNTVTFATEEDLVEDMFESYPSLRETENLQEEVKKEDGENPNPFINQNVIHTKPESNSVSYSEQNIPYVSEGSEEVGFEEKVIIKEVNAPVMKKEIRQPVNETVEKMVDDFKQNETKNEVNPFSKYQLPSLGLLNDLMDQAYFENKQTALAKSVLINEKLAALGIKGRVVNQHVAPAFTRYEIALDSAEKMNQFSNIAKDLQSALAAPSISILAPIPNSMNAGVDVPNDVRGMVGLKDVLSNLSYDVPTLYVGLGKDSIGRNIGINLADTPHLLVAGTTGTGKSVCMNTLIISLLMHAKPDELKMVMVDPKRVEMAPYRGIPHLACPVITDIKKAGVALQKLVGIMHERFKLFETIGVRNISSYNRLMKKQNKPIMPYYVIFIDEMADLFNRVKSAEQTLIEICSLARAAGMHVVCATQRPSADVITSNIKVNIPSRIAFAVSSMGDSKTILGQSGAEGLLGKGDMIVNIPGQLAFVRAQGAYVTDDEITDVTEFVKRQGEPIYNPTLLDLEVQTNNEIDFDASDSSENELASKVIEFLKKVQQVSTTKIQNRFGIGYPRAAKVMDMLEDKGLIEKDPATKLWILAETFIDEEIIDD